MFSGSGGPSRDGGGGNEEDKMETEEEVIKTYLIFHKRYFYLFLGLGVL